MAVAAEFPNVGVLAFVIFGAPLLFSADPGHSCRRHYKEKKMVPVLKLFFDGGCRPNPGEMELAVVARGNLYHLDRQGHGSSHQAEWLALLHALKVARELGETDVQLLGDSRAVVEQANGRLKCRGSALQASLAAFQAEARQFARLRVRHIARTQNLAGMALGKIREATRGGQDVRG